MRPSRDNRDARSRSTEAPDSPAPLLEGGLVDELRLVIAPVIVGSGRRLFEPGSAPIGLTLTASSSTPGGLTLNSYTVDGAAAIDTYDPAKHTFPST